MLSVPERKGTKFKDLRKEMAYIQYKKHNLESPIISVNIWVAICGTVTFRPFSLKELLIFMLFH